LERVGSGNAGGEGDLSVAALMAAPGGGLIQAEGERVIGKVGIAGRGGEGERLPAVPLAELGAIKVGA